MANSTASMKLSIDKKSKQANCDYDCFSYGGFPPAYGVCESDDDCRRAEDGTLVKGEVMYMVTNLEVKPMSTISTITLLNMFNVKEAGDLEEKVVTLGIKEAVKLLKATLESENVLTQVLC